MTIWYQHKLNIKLSQPTLASADKICYKKRISSGMQTGNSGLKIYTVRKINKEWIVKKQIKYFLTRSNKLHRFCTILMGITNYRDRECKLFVAGFG